MISRPIHWFSGQFLDPQHLQESDRRQEQERLSLLHAARPFFWGVHELEIDASLLAGQLLACKKVEMVFPDGSRVRMDRDSDDGNMVMPRRSFADAWPEDAATLTAYAVLDDLKPIHNVGGICQPGAEPPESSARFYVVAGDEPVADRYALPHPSLADGGSLISTLCYNVRILWEHEIALASGMTMPLVRLKKEAAGVVQDPDFTPPLARASASSAFLALLDATTARLAEFAALPPPAASRGEVELAMRIEAARAVSQIQLHRQWVNESVWTLFGIVRGAVAAMASAASWREPRLAADLPEYTHFDPAWCFGRLRQELERILAPFAPEAAVILEARVVDNLLLFDLPDSVLSKGLTPILAVKCDEPIRTILDEGRLVAGTHEDTISAIRRALPAVPLQPRHDVRASPFGSGYAFLAPDTRDSGWKRVLETRTFAVAYYPSSAAATAASVKLFFSRT